MQRFVILVCQKSNYCINLIVLTNQTPKARRHDAASPAQGRAASLFLRHPAKPTKDLLEVGAAGLVVDGLGAQPPVGEQISAAGYGNLVACSPRVPAGSAPQA